MNATQNHSSIWTMPPQELASALGYPTTWIGLNASQVKHLVVRAGGWGKVFPRKLPKWAHNIRQFFNEEPETLTRLSEQESKRRIGMAYGIRAIERSKKNLVVGYLAPSGDVYREGTKRHWIEQSQAGTRYHYMDGQKMGDVGHTLYAAVTRHRETDAFKMCLPDHTGGSCEAVFRNHRKQDSLLRVYERADVKPLALTVNRFRGSYNYCDTMAGGYDGHVRLDVEPDNRWGSNYIDERQFSPLSTRIFRPEHFPH